MRTTLILLGLALIACGDDDAAGGSTSGTTSTSSSGGTSSGGTSSGGTSSGGTSSSGGTTTPGAPIAKKDGGFPGVLAKDKNAFIDAVAGTYDIAIYRTPADKTNLIGPAKLTVTHTGTELAAKITTGDGTVVQAVTNDTENPRAYGQAAVTPIIGKVLIDQRDATPLTRIDFSVTEAGGIYGVIGGLADYAFRNDILAYGTAVPAQLKALDGTWKGDAQAKLCPSPVEATFAAGKVTVKGTPQPGCKGEQTNEVTWNGNDDYVVSNVDGTPQIFIDTANGGGSNPTGGTRINLNADGSIRELTVFFTGFAGSLPMGDIASGSLKKQ